VDGVAAQSVEFRAVAVSMRAFDLIFYHFWSYNPPQRRIYETPQLAYSVGELDSVIRRHGRITTTPVAASFRIASIQHWLFVAQSCEQD
jgi:hypothetical protein